MKLRKIKSLTRAAALFACACVLVVVVTASARQQDAPPAQEGATPAAQGEATPSPSPSRATRAARARAGERDAAKKDAKRAGEAAAGGEAAAVAEDEATLKAELDEVVKLPVGERVERLSAFVAAHPRSESTLRARELLVGARAALGDERLSAGDSLKGIQYFNEAVADFAPEMSERLFEAVVAQLPANLYLRSHREAGVELARRIEERVRENPRRLLGVASFYLGVELSEDAARVAAEAVRLAPDSAPARQALGAALRLSLRLEESAAEYARAVELDPRSTAARRALADMRRATGKPEEAATLYRELLAAEATDAAARTGLVLSLFESGRREEAERELESALAAQPENLPLLVGASYWFSSRGEGARALELAERAVRLEPRYRWVWARVALGRALLAARRPLDAVGVLREARALGRFPTLDYELASALAAAGLYDEAAEELAQTFKIRDGQIETLLAGRRAARAGDFAELLAPERRASTFLYAAADTPENTRQLKALL
ncbi:MAG TPA: tetratricopeptide repeat protein, partial [Pyrinomonadaceae bacterium]|nr:tetratricopeptide repeat protein [Pyrinomonadaceae bacterium]